MASGIIDFTQSAASGTYIEGRIEWTSTPNISAGTSDVTAKLYVRKRNHSMTLTIATEGTWAYTLVVNGSSQNVSVKKSVLQDWVYLGSKTVNGILHDPGGSKRIIISGSITAPTTSEPLKGHSTIGGKEVDLDIITRATVIDSLTCNSTDVTGDITAYYTPRNTGCYNRCIVYVNVGGTLTELQREDLGTKNTTQQSYPIKFGSEALSTIYAKVPNTATAVIQVTFQTYASNVNGVYTTKIGENSRTKELSLPSSIAPTASLKITPVNSNSWIKSQNIYVAGLSGATAVLSSKAGEGAKLTSTAITYDGTTTASNGAETYTVNVTTLKKSGNNIEFSAKATDSRGRYATDSKSIPVLSYSAPAITSLQVERGKYNNVWVAKEGESDVRVTFKTNLSLTANGNNYSVAFKINGEDKEPNHGEIDGLTSGTEHAVYFTGLNGEASHTLVMTATDKVGIAGTAKLTIPTINITMEFNDSGKGIAFGKTSEIDAFECAMPAVFSSTVNFTETPCINGTSLDTILSQNASTINENDDGSISLNGIQINDFVIEQGTNGIWTYRKWSSGLAECWGVTTEDVFGLDTAYAGVYYSEPTDGGKLGSAGFPSGLFSELPAHINVQNYGTPGLIGCHISGISKDAVTFYVSNPIRADLSLRFSVEAKGRWK